MTITLRTRNDTILADIEVTAKDVRASVPIKTYSEFLLAQSPRMWVDVSADFSTIDELRGWYWEVFSSQTSFHSEEQKPQPSLKETVTAIMDILRPIAQKYGLSVVTD